MPWRLHDGKDPMAYKRRSSCRCRYAHLSRRQVYRSPNLGLHSVLKDHNRLHHTSFDSNFQGIVSLVSAGIQLYIDCARLAGQSCCLWGTCVKMA